MDKPEVKALGETGEKKLSEIYTVTGCTSTKRIQGSERAKGKVTKCRNSAGIHYTVGRFTVNGSYCIK